MYEKTIRNNKSRENPASIDSEPQQKMYQPS